jgi:hypothetical protein
VVGHAADLGMDFRAAQLFRGDFFTGCGLDKRGAAQEDGAVALDYYRLIGHGGNISAACRARAHNDRNLRDFLGRHIGLVEEDASEVVTVGEDFGLQG